MKKVKLGVPIDLKLTSRYYQFNKEFAIRDVYDALVELITNSDDSYHRLYKNNKRSEDGGQILIEVLKQKKGESSLVVVHDKAEGLTMQEMHSKFGEIGERSSGSGDRGFMGRGAKDCTALGKMTVESIKDDKYYKCELTTKAQLIPLESKTAASSIRRKLGIDRGNGTVISLEISAKHAIPHVSTICRDLPWHYALRDILSEKSTTKVLIKNINQPKRKPERIVYSQPEAELVCKESFIVPGYQQAKAELTIWKHSEAFDDPPGRSFRRSGMLIKGERAIHECSLLQSGFERDTHALKYFGKLECAYIDTLMNEYDERLKNDQQQPPENPSILVDPNRRDGLMKEHPFTKALLQIPTKRLKSLIDEDKKLSQTTKKELTSKETKEKLNELAKAASKFLTQQIEDLEELTEGDDVDDNFFRQKGVLIYPTFPRVGVGEIRSLTFYVNRMLFDIEGAEVNVSSENKALSILDSTFQLKAHPKKKDRLIGSFRIRGEKLIDSVTIETKNKDLPNAEAIAQVVENTIEDRIFSAPLEFEHKLYSLKEGSSKTLKLFAKYPELVNEEIEVKVSSYDSTSVPILGRCIATPVSGTNYALGEITIKGRRLLKSAVTITASINGDTALAKVKVKQKEDKGVKIEIDIKDEDFGNFRAKWAEHEGKPNLLLISGRHDSIKRHLRYNPDTDKWDGDKEPYFRVLLAEIVADSVCRKALRLEAQERAWEFKFADLKDDSLIAEAVLVQLQKRMRDFSGIAHKIMYDFKE